jgi:hypothetical protein
MQAHGHMSNPREVPVENLSAQVRKDAQDGDYDLDWLTYSKDDESDGYRMFYGNTVWVLSQEELQKLFKLMPEVTFHERPWDDDDDWEPTAEKVVEALLGENQSDSVDSLKWITPKEARPYIPDDVLELIPMGAKVAVVHGGELADCWIYNDFKGGVRVYINGKWDYARNEHDAYDKFLEQDDWAS